MFSKNAVKLKWFAHKNEVVETQFEFKKCKFRRCFMNYQSTDNLIYIKSNARPLKLGPCLHGTGQIWNRAEISPFQPCVYTKTTKTDEFGIS
jgi:hypothetical protein